MNHRSLKRVAIWCVVFIAAAIVFLMATSAFAQDSGTVVGVDGFYAELRPFLVEVIVAIVAAIAGWVLMTVRKKLGLDIEAKHREALQSALMNGANYGLRYIDGKVGGATIDVRNEMLAEAVRFVERSVPDAVKFFGLTPDKLRDHLAAKIPVAQAVANA